MSELYQTPLNAARYLTIRCRVCKGERFKLLIEQNRSPGHVISISECADCGEMYQSFTQDDLA